MPSAVDEPPPRSTSASESSLATGTTPPRDGLTARSLVRAAVPTGDVELSDPVELFRLDYDAEGGRVVSLEPQDGARCAGDVDETSKRAPEHRSVSMLRSPATSSPRRKK